MFNVFSLWLLKSCWERKETTNGISELWKSVLEGERKNDIKAHRLARTFLLIQILFITSCQWHFIGKIQFVLSILILNRTWRLYWGLMAWAEGKCYFESKRESNTADPPSHWFQSEIGEGVGREDGGSFKSRHD